MGCSEATAPRFRIKEALLLFLSYILPLILRWRKGSKKLCAREEEKGEVVSLLLQPDQYLLVQLLGDYNWINFFVTYFRVSFCQTAVLFSHFAVLHKILTFSFPRELLLKNHDSAKMLYKIKN